MPLIIEIIEYEIIKYEIIDYDFLMKYHTLWHSKHSLCLSVQVIGNIGVSGRTHLMARASVIAQNWKQVKSNIVSLCFHPYSISSILSITTRTISVLYI